MHLTAIVCSWPPYVPRPLVAVVALICSCWRRDPAQRPTAEQVVQTLQALLGPEAAAEGSKDSGSMEGSAGQLPGSGDVQAAVAPAPAAQPPPKPQQKARPANPFQSRADKLFP